MRVFNFFNCRDCNFYKWCILVIARNLGHKMSVLSLSIDARYLLEEDKILCTYSCDGKTPRSLEIKVLHPLRDRIEDKNNERATLIATWFLLVHFEVAGQNRAGIGLKIEFSRDEVVRACSLQSRTAGLNKLATFLRTQFIGAEIRLVCASSRANFFEPFACAVWAETSLQLPGAWAQGLGFVSISPHAIHKYYERTRGDLVLDKVFRKIQFHIKGALPVKALPQKVIRDKRTFYGSRQNNTFYYQTKTGWQMVIEKRKGRLILATIYQRLLDN